MGFETKYIDDVIYAIEGDLEAKLTSQTAGGNSVELTFEVGNHIDEYELEDIAMLVSGSLAIRSVEAYSHFVPLDGSPYEVVLIIHF